MSHMRQITVRIHNESGVWWAESPEVPGFSAAADTRDELRELIREGVAYALDDQAHMILEASWSQSKPAEAVTRATSRTPNLFPTFGYRASRRPSSVSTNPRSVLA